MAKILNIPDYNGAGVYLIKGINNPYKYVGSTIHVAARIVQHQQVFARNGGNKKMKKVLSDDDCFEVCVLEKISDKRSKYYIYDREYYYAVTLNSYGEDGLNSGTIQYHGGYSFHNLQSKTLGIYNDIKLLMLYAKDLENRIENKNWGEEYQSYLIGVTEKNLRRVLQNMLDNLQPLNKS